MLTEWTISNFKSISKRVNMPMAALTLVCGANSSGKSTLIQSILMIAQTLASPAIQRPLILNGELVKLGYLLDVAHAGNVGESIYLGFSLVKKKKNNDDDQPEIQFSGIFYNPNITNTITSKVDIISSSLQIGDVSIRANAQTGRLLSDSINYQNWQIPDALIQEIKNGLFNFDLESQEEMKISHTSLPKSRYCSLSHFLPYAKLVEYDSGKEDIRQAILECARNLSRGKQGQLTPIGPDLDLKTGMGRTIKEEISKIIGRLRQRKSHRSDVSIQELETSVNLLHRSSTLREWADQLSIRISARSRDEIVNDLIHYVRRNEVIETSSSNKTGVKTEPFDQEIVGATTEIIDFFKERIRYLGPLRDDPKMIYSIPSLPDSKDVGMKGEYTATVLQRFGKEVQVECPLPPNGDFSALGSTTMALIDAVILWLRHMELIDNVMIEDRGKMGVELTLHSTGLTKSLDLTNVGVGVSQIIPILTMCLLAPDDGLVMLEQPELHLHPKVQMILGDFLIGIATRGTQCIVETHSDRLINRVRRRIAEDAADEIMHLTRIYFFEKKGIETQILPVEPNEYGVIQRWPKGFFDEGPDESQRIVMAANRKREARLQNRDLK